MRIKALKRLVTAAAGLALVGVGGHAFAAPYRTHATGDEGKLLPASIRVGGGMEGQTGVLRSQLTEGPMWSATAAVQPLSFMGLEATYSGATANVDSDQAGISSGGVVKGADFIRNGGQVAATINAPSRFVQPYVLGGVGVDRYTFRGVNNAQFKDDTAGRVPLGAGIKATSGMFVADLRANYNALFNQDFAVAPGQTKNGGTYDLGLQIGGQF